MIRSLVVALIGGRAAGAVALVGEFAILAATVRAGSQDDSAGLGAVSAPSYAPYVAIVGFIVVAVLQWKRKST